MKVDFMIVGAQKCGTTTLFDILNSHKQLVGSFEKEPQFFSRIDWRADINEYESLFQKTENVLYFEASTEYTFTPHAQNKKIVDDLYEYNPELKFIYIVRNPIDRIVSAYMHLEQSGYRIRNINIEVTSNPFFIDISKYYLQISPYIKRFGRGQVKIIEFNDLVNKQSEIIREIVGFLGVDYQFELEVGNYHTHKSIGSVRHSYKFNKIIKYVKKVTKNLPNPLLNQIKQIYKKSLLLTKKNTVSKPLLNADARAFIFAELSSDIAQLENLLERKLMYLKK